MKKEQTKESLESTVNVLMEDLEKMVVERDNLKIQNEDLALKADAIGGELREVLGLLDDAINAAPHERSREAWRELQTMIIDKGRRKTWIALGVIDDD